MGDYWHMHRQPVSNLNKTKLTNLLYLVVAASALPNPTPSDEDEDEEDAAPTHAEVDDDGRVYKNPRNSPSAQCPRDEEQATLLVSL